LRVVAAGLFRVFRCIVLTATESKHFGVVEERTRASVQRIGALRGQDCCTRYSLSVVVLTLVSEELRANWLPREPSIEIVLRREHIEVALGDSGDQILLRRLVISLGMRDLGISALQRHPVLQATYVLFEIDAVFVVA